MDGAFKEFSRQLKRALESDLAALLSLAEGEKVYAVALMTDSFVDQLQVMINSEESLQYQIDHALMHQKKEQLSEEELWNYRWNPTFWRYSLEHIHLPKMQEINQFLYSKEVSDLAAFEMGFYEAVITTLRGIINRSDLFLPFEPNLPLFFMTIHNDSRAPMIEEYSAKELNSEEDFARFQARL